MTRAEAAEGLRAAESFGHPALIAEWRAVLAGMDGAE